MKEEHVTTSSTEATTIQGQPIETSKWYAIYTRSNFEKKVQEDLSKSKFETFLPLVKEIRFWSDRKKTILVPLLRSYVFVKLSSPNIQKILYYPGVIRLVSFEGKPCEVREEEIHLLENIVMHGFVAENTANVGVGDAVRVVRGPLKGWEGKVETKKGQSRIVFQITSIGQCISVEARMGDLEKIG